MMDKTRQRQPAPSRALGYPLDIDDLAYWGEVVSAPIYRAQDILQHPGQDRGPHPTHRRRDDAVARHATAMPLTSSGIT